MDERDMTDIEINGWSREKEMDCPECGTMMETVIFDRYGGGYQCSKCKYQILMEDEDEE